ncbi:MAG: flagellar protein [Lachnospiraceae bacterium]|nr:flagellar protein [Lachnospiraceae bacterium]
MRVLNPNSQYPSIQETASRYLKDAGSRGQRGTEENKTSFAEILQEKQTAGAELKFSKHASGRLSDRNIELSDSQLNRLMAGTQKASQKGINETLVIMDELAFIVNARNNTVITAMDQKESDENVFTNIDGAVIV